MAGNFIVNTHDSIFFFFLLKIGRVSVKILDSSTVSMKKNKKKIKKINV